MYDSDDEGEEEWEDGDGNMATELSTQEDHRDICSIAVSMDVCEAAITQTRTRTHIEHT